VGLFLISQYRMKAQDRKSQLEKKAEKFIQQKPLQYSTVTPFDVPNKEGILHKPENKKR
jgi:hypothetical protein